MLASLIDPSDRPSAVLRARERIAGRPLYLDTETTGLDEASEIVEVCIIDADGASLVDTLVRPSGRIPPGATKIHGITDEMVADAPSWPEVWPAVESVIAGREVGIYNADYDLAMIRRCNARHQLQRREKNARGFCIMKLYARFAGDRKPNGEFRWHRLEAAGEQCGIDLLNAHRARADTLLARALLHHMAR